MNKHNITRMIAGVCMVAMTAVTLTGCNISEEDVPDTLRAAIENTRADGYEVYFELDTRELVLYPEMQLAKYQEEADSGTRYDFSEDEDINYEMGVNRTNWNDGDSTEWVETQQQYTISFDKDTGIYNTKLSILHPPQKNAQTGEVEEDAYTEELTESVESIESDSINYLEQLFASYSAVEEMATFNVQGVKRIGQDIIRVETETINLTNGEIGIYDEDLDNYVIPGTQTTLVGVDSHEWEDEDGNIQIDNVVIGRMDFTIKDGKITNIEMYYETIHYLEVDQRNYTRGGRIYTKQEAMIAKTEQCVIDFEDDD
ncbi:MAG: hypothetical protein LIO46_06835 [Clostridiales bacterium]|nr:hypothetical protein [Clostridiales bacterium]